MASAWAKWAAIAAFLVVCVILVHAAPSSIYDEEMEPAEDQQQTSVDDLYTAEDAATLAALRAQRRTRRDSIGAYSHGHSKGWGWYPPVGPVFTYVRTDPWANFQWGVRHKVYGWGWKG